jgi:hypothetical protein
MTEDIFCDHVSPPETMRGEILRQLGFLRDTDSVG